MTEVEREKRFDHEATVFKSNLAAYADSLIAEFGSNKKARVFLNSQLFTNADPDVHEFIKIAVKKLERIALSQ